MEKVDAVSATAGVLDTLPEPWARRGRWRGALGCSGGRAPETPVPKCRVFFLSAVALSCYKLFLERIGIFIFESPEVPIAQG